MVVGPSGEKVGGEQVREEGTVCNFRQGDGEGDIGVTEGREGAKNIDSRGKKAPGWGDSRC